MTNGMGDGGGMHFAVPLYNHIQTKYRERRRPSKLNFGVNQRCVMLQDPSGVIDHIVDDLLCGEDFVYLSGDATGEPWPGTERLFGVLIEVILVWDDALLEKRFGFGLTVVLPDEESGHRMVISRAWSVSNIPIFNVRTLDHSQGSPSINQSPHKVIMTSIHDRLLVHRWCTSLLASYEPGTDPHGLGAPSQVGRETPTVVNGTGTDNQDGSTGERRFLSFDHVHDGRDQDRGRHVAGVSTSLTGLSADNVDTNFESFGDMLGMANHLVDE